MVQLSVVMTEKSSAGEWVALMAARSVASKETTTGASTVVQTAASLVGTLDGMWDALWDS